MVSKFDENSKPSGITMTYLDSMHPTAKYWCYDNQGNEKIYHQGPILYFVKDMPLEDDRNNF